MVVSWALLFCQLHLLFYLVRFFTTNIVSIVSNSSFFFSCCYLFRQYRPYICRRLRPHAPRPPRADRPTTLIARGRPNRDAFPECPPHALLPSAERPCMTDAVIRPVANDGGQGDAESPSSKKRKQSVVRPEFLVNDAAKERGYLSVPDYLEPQFDLEGAEIRSLQTPPTAL